MFVITGVIFFISVVVLLGSGVPFLSQAPLRKRGVVVDATVARRSVPRDGKIDVEYLYITNERERHTIWQRGCSQYPQGGERVIYDPQNPKRAEFVIFMSRNPRKKLTFLVVLASVMVVALALLCIGLVM
ncbi:MULTISPECIES: DUF3592 domain-containing protein [unclassified Streptomyces]|uniref:DUF3592 domain-containing protein n=1 Tax=unclassified Streptomyces TaxID=2593676 RepID=UPI002E1CFA2B|nr:DUF3592 domain-containing protein [Streptomyces sp. NBC_01023]